MNRRPNVYAVTGAYKRTNIVRFGKSICSYSRFMFPRCGLKGVCDRALMRVVRDRHRRGFKGVGCRSLPARYGRYSFLFTYGKRYPGGHFDRATSNRPKLGCLYGKCCRFFRRMTPCVSCVGGRLVGRHPPTGVVRTLEGKRLRVRSWRSCVRVLSLGGRRAGALFVDTSDTRHILH